MTTPELMHRLEQSGAALAVLDGELAVEFDGELPNDLDAELETHAADIIEALRSGTGPKPDPDAADHRSPAGHQSGRDVLTFDVRPGTPPRGHRPDRPVETAVADLHRLGVVMFFDGRTLTVDARRGALDDRRREFIADRWEDLAAAVTWLEQLDRRNLYRRALSSWVTRHAGFLHGLRGFRCDNGRYVNRLDHARRLLAWEHEGWAELFRFVDEIERFGADIQHNQGTNQREGAKS